MESNVLFFRLAVHMLFVEKASYVWMHGISLNRTLITFPRTSPVLPYQSLRLLRPTFQILLPERIGIHLWATVERSPLRILLEQPHSLDVIIIVRCEAVVDARRQDNQIPRLQPNPHPLVPLTPHIEIPRPALDIPDLFIFMQVLVEEGLHFRLVDLAHGSWGDGDYIAVLVGAGGGEGVDFGFGGDAVVEHAQGRELVDGYGTGWGRLVGKTLVALVFC